MKKNIKVKAKRSIGPLVWNLSLMTFICFGVIGGAVAGAQYLYYGYQEVALPFILSVFPTALTPPQSIVLSSNGEFKWEPLSPKEKVGECVSTDIHAHLQVYISDKLPATGVEGMFIPSSGSIVVKETSKSLELLEIVAHEVSHFVDAVVRAKNINDGETRAYLQGYFTDCVYKLVTKL